MAQLTLPLQVEPARVEPVLDRFLSFLPWHKSVSAFAEVGGDDHAFLRARTPSAANTSGPDFRVADLFSGCGGISLGVREACNAAGRQFRSVLAIDNHAQSLATYVANLAPKCVLSTPIELVFSLPGSGRLSRMERGLRHDVGRVDLLVGGPPCQGHSDLNNFARRSDSKNGLYLYMARAAEVLQPEHILIENVLGAVHDKSRVLQTTREQLERLGYGTSLGIVDVLMLGVPQRRRRLLLLGSQSQQPPDVDQLDQVVNLPSRDLGWAIEDLEDAPSAAMIDSVGQPNPTTTKRIDYLFDNDVYDLPNEERPPCHRDKDHTYNSIYGRLRWDRPAQTITRGFYCMCMGRYVHPSRRRTLTAHEAARLQFFPDFFDFSPVRNRSALAEIIGNAVPMKLSYLAGIALMQPEPTATPGRG